MEQEDSAHAAATRRVRKKAAGSRRDRDRAEDESVLLARIRDGDRDAFAMLLQRYARKIASIASELAPSSSPASEARPDLYIAGCEVFWKACKRFNPEHPRVNTLWSYAFKWVNGAMIKEHSVIMELKESTRKVYPKVTACRDDLLVRFGREPTMDEIAECAETTLDHVQAIFRAWAKTTFSGMALPGPGEDESSYDPPLGDDTPDGGTNPRPFPPVDEALRVKELSEFVVRVFASSPTKALQFLVLNVLNLEDITQAESARLLANEGNHQLAQSWLEICKWYGLENTLPTTWQGVCALFATPPPTLNQANLAQFMKRCRDTLTEAREQFDRAH